MRVFVAGATGVDLALNMTHRLDGGSILLDYRLRGT